MKTKKLGIIPLLLLAPIVTANSPAPQVQSTPYNDFTATFVSKIPNVDGTEGLFEYCYSINNTGTGYLSYVRAEKDGKSEAYIHLNNDTYGDIVLGPNKTMEITFYSRTDYEASGGLTFSGNGFTEFLENPFKDNNFVVEEREHYENSYYFYIKVGFNFDVNESGYRFGAIIDATYKGEEVSILDEYISTKDQLYFSYYSDTPFELDQFTINDIKIIKTEYHSPYGFLGNFFQVLEVVTIVFIAVVMGSGLLFICIFFPIREARRRKRLKEQKGQ